MATLKLSAVARLYKSTFQTCRVLTRQFASESVGSGDKAKTPPPPPPAPAKNEAVVRFAEGQSDNSQYKTEQYYQHNEYSFYDFEVEMQKDRLEAPKKEVPYKTPTTKI